MPIHLSRPGGSGEPTDLTMTPLIVTWTDVDQVRPVTTRPVWWLGPVPSPPTNVAEGDIVTRTSA